MDPLIRKVAIALDPFSEDLMAGAEKAAHSVKPFIRNKNVAVEAIYVMTPKGVGIPLNEFPAHYEFYKKVATELIDKVVASLGISPSIKITVLAEGSHSNRAAVDSLLKYLQTNPVDLVALTTHARKGVSRWFLGSFAETLMLRSPFPLLVTNPSVPWEPEIKRMFFATDFSPHAKVALDQAAEWAKFLDLPMTIFHRVDAMSPVLLPPGYLAEVQWQRHKSEKEQKAQALKAQMERAGIKAEVALAVHNESVTSALLETASASEGPLIALPTQFTSPFMAMGSVPRQIIRSANCPVLVIPISDSQLNKEVSR